MRMTTATSTSNAGCQTCAEHQAVLDRLENLQETDTGWMASCPAHADEGVSLSIVKEANGGLKINCLQCSGQALIQALGLPEWTLADTDGSVYVDNPNAPPLISKSKHSTRARKSKRGKEKKADVKILFDSVEDADFFHTPDGEAYVTVQVASHHETYLVGSDELSSYLIDVFYRETNGRVPASELLNGVIRQLEARARIDGREERVYIRVANLGSTVYVDLCNSNWEVIEIGDQGWRVVSDPPVKFRRSPAMRPLPISTRGVQLSELRRFLNLSSPRDWVLCVAWLVASLFGGGPFVILLLLGEQGSGKTNTSRRLRSLVDPSTVPLRSIPKNEHDLMIAAENSWIVAFDNVSDIPGWLPDALCRIATGSGFGTRELYKNKKEALFAGTRPQILNGIEPISDRPDLMDRSIQVELPAIDPRSRRTETELDAEFERVRPGILGGLLDVVAGALSNVSNTHLEVMPRMADFAKLITAAEPVLGWKPGTFIKIYNENRNDAMESATDGDPVVEALEAQLRVDGDFEGTANELLVELALHIDVSRTKLSDWPKAANKLSGKLQRLKPALRARGIFFDSRKSNGRRVVTITRGIDPDRPCNDLIDPVSTLTTVVSTLEGSAKPLANGAAGPQGSIELQGE